MHQQSHHHSHCTTWWCKHLVISTFVFDETYSWASHLGFHEIYRLFCCNQSFNSSKSFASNYISWWKFPLCSRWPHSGSPSWCTRYSTDVHSFIRQFLAFSFCVSSWCWSWELIPVPLLCWSHFITASLLQALLQCWFNIHVASFQLLKLVVIKVYSLLLDNVSCFRACAFQHIIQ